MGTAIKSNKSNKRAVTQSQRPPKYLVEKVRKYNSILKQQNKRYSEIYADIKRINNRRKKQILKSK